MSVHTKECMSSSTNLICNECSISMFELTKVVSGFWVVLITKMICSYLMSFLKL